MSTAHDDQALYRNITPTHVEKAKTEVQGEIGRRELREFAKMAWTIVDPQPLIWSWMMDAICDHLYWVLEGEIRNLIINQPPRTSKSLLGAVFFPAHAWIERPELQFLTASYDKNLATRDAIKTRHLFTSSWYRERWGDSFALHYDMNQADRYMNDKGGHRICVSPTSRATGEGGNILLCDDPHHAIEVESDVQRNATLNWHDNAWRSRMNNPKTDHRIYIGQRTHDSDLFGHLLGQAPDEYVHLSLPATFVRASRCRTYRNPQGLGSKKIKKKNKLVPDPKEMLFEDPRTEDGALLSSDRLDQPFLDAQRKAMSEAAFYAQYEQDTTAGGGMIIKSAWWREWSYPTGHRDYGKDRKLPVFDEIIQSYDTALDEEEIEANSYHARTTWGLFWHRPEWYDPIQKKLVREEQTLCAMILERWYDRTPYPTLRKEAIRSYKEWKPDRILIEKKASGFSLLQELRRARLPVRGVKIEGGRRARDKVARANLAVIVLEKGLIYYRPRRWFYEVRTMCSKFPKIQHADIVDTIVQAWAYLRKRRMLQLPDDPKSDLNLYRDQPTRKAGYG